MTFGLHKTELPVLVVLTTLLLSSCSATLPENPRTEENRHLEPPQASDSEDIPNIVDPLPLVTAPQPQVNPELYSISAQDVSVRELLFAMGRDANINIDVHPAIDGTVSINAIDQTMPQILERISRQIDIRWNFDANDNLLVEPDSEYWATYRFDYVNVDRTSSTAASISTGLGNVGEGGGGGASGNNASTATLNQTSTNNFWQSLTQNLTDLLSEDTAAVGEGNAESLVINPETGLINVRADSKQHRDVETFLNLIQSRSLHQVMIEATVVEVDLNDDYQSGVDWNALRSDTFDINFVQNVTSPELINNPTSFLTISDSDNNDDVSAAISMLSRFGDLRVLSSPRIMTLNNQVGLLRVVDNVVYFNVDVEPGTVAQGVFTPAVFTTEVQTVPVGFVMTVTPQIGDNDQITLNVRPTISRIVRFVNDPNPGLATAGVVNEIPVTQIREMESILKVYSGQVAVLGGLMQDSLQEESQGIPGLSRLPGIRNLFSYRSESAKKTELIVFIRPTIIRQPSLDGDFENYRNFLPTDGIQFNTPPEFGRVSSDPGP
jgi:general secretion pathway protein D